MTAFRYCAAVVPTEVRLLAYAHSILSMPRKHVGPLSSEFGFLEGARRELRFDANFMGIYGAVLELWPNRV